LPGSSALQDIYNLESSVFTVYRGALAGPRYAGQSDESFDVAVVTFNDDGSYVNPAHLTNAVACIDAVRAKFAAGAIVVVFVHGWHHNADWDIGTNEGDSHFRDFRRILMTLALRERERPEHQSRRVVGIYLGWNGDPVDSWRAHLPGHFTFWNRYRIAQTIGDGKPIQDTLASIVEHAKSSFERESGGEAPACPLVVAGHSMGALIVASAFRRLLHESPETLTRKTGGNLDRDVQVTRDGEAIVFPDLLLLLNSAADSRIVKEIIDSLKAQNVRKLFRTGGNVRFLAPLLISLTSTHDRATSIAWRFANPPWRKTDGHDPSLFTHRFGVEEVSVVCVAKNDMDWAVRSFGQPWHCLRRPEPVAADWPTFRVDLPQTARLDESPSAGAQHTRYSLTPIVKSGRPADAETSRSDHPFWVFQVPPQISADHNDIFNFRSSLLMLALMQISGAVVSLAKTLDDVFE
jgi:hypothetical protein